MADEESRGYINISISEEGMEYDTNFSIMEVVFWMDALKARLFAKAFESES